MASELLGIVAYCLICNRVQNWFYLLILCQNATILKINCSLQVSSSPDRMKIVYAAAYIAFKKCADC